MSNFNSNFGGNNSVNNNVNSTPVNNNNSYSAAKPTGFWADLAGKAKNMVTPANAGKAAVVGLALYGGYKAYKNIKSKFFSKKDETPAAEESAEEQEVVEKTTTKKATKKA